MSWFGYVWIVMLIIIYGLWTVKYWKEAIEEKEPGYIVVWILPQLLVLFIASVMYFMWQRGR